MAQAMMVYGCGSFMGVVWLNIFRKEFEEVCTAEEENDGDEGKDEEEAGYKVPVFQSVG